MQRMGFPVFDHFSGGSDLRTSHRFRSCICALIFEGGGVPVDAENSVSRRVSREPRIFLSFSDSFVY